MTEDAPKSPVTRADKLRERLKVKRQRRVHMRLDVTLESDHNFYTGFAENISDGGLFLSTPDLMPIGSRFRIDFSLPDRAEPIHVLCEVRWQRLEQHDNPDFSAGMGVRFLELSEDERDSIHHFIAQRETLFYADDD